MNKHKCRIWTVASPFTIVEAAMNSFKVNVCCAMSNKQIVGPYLFENEIVNRQNYLQMLTNCVYPIMQRKRLINKVILQEDNALPHFSKEWFNEKLNERWIDRGDPISWAVQSLEI